MTIVEIGCNLRYSSTFAGAGFVAKNLWGSRKYLSMIEWMQIFAILAIFIISGKFLYAVLAGIIFTCVDFTLIYAKVPCTSQASKKGAELSSTRRSQLLTQSALYMENDLMLLVRLKGLAFFALAQALVLQLREVDGGRAAREEASGEAAGENVPSMS